MAHFSFRPMSVLVAEDMFAAVTLDTPEDQIVSFQMSNQCLGRVPRV